MLRGYHFSYLYIINSFHYKVVVFKKGFLLLYKSNVFTLQ